MGDRAAEEKRGKPSKPALVGQAFSQLSGGEGAGAGRGDWTSLGAARAAEGESEFGGTGSGQGRGSAGREG